MIRDKQALENEEYAKRTDWSLFTMFCQIDLYMYANPFVCIRLNRILRIISTFLLSANCKQWIIMRSWGPLLCAYISTHLQKIIIRIQIQQQRNKVVFELIVWKKMSIREHLILMLFASCKFWLILTCASWVGVVACMCSLFILHIWREKDAQNEKKSFKLNRPADACV